MSSAQQCGAPTTAGTACLLPKDTCRHHPSYNTQAYGARRPGPSASKRPYMPTKADLQIENDQLQNRVASLEAALQQIPEALEWTGYEADVHAVISELVPGLIYRNYRIVVTLTAELSKQPPMDEVEEWLIQVIEEGIENHHPCSLSEKDGSWELKVDGIAAL